VHVHAEMRAALRSGRASRDWTTATFPGLPVRLPAQIKKLRAVRIAQK
jgi:hypothetical protein